LTFPEWFGAMNERTARQRGKAQPPLGAQFPDFELEAKLEIFSSIFGLSQSGHFSSAFSEAFFTSVSNSAPHLRHSNS